MTAGGGGFRLLHSSGSVPRVRARFDRLTPGTPGRWGRLDAPRMLVHVSDQLRMALGDLTFPLRPPPAGARILIPAILWFLPWPRNIPGAGRGHVTELGSFAADRAALDQLLDRFTARPLTARWAPHSAFGPLSGPAWSRLAWRHLDHHLTQFGV